MTLNETGIEWTDFTFNPITGCKAISEGCANCYAKAVANRLWAEREFHEIMFHSDRLLSAIKMNKQLASGKKIFKSKTGGNRPIIFLGSMTDLFQKDVDPSWLDEIFEVVKQCEQMDFLVLTKRPKRMQEYFKRTVTEQGKSPLPNLWLGVTIEMQKYVEERIKDLTDTPATKRFLSVEPLLEKVILPDWTPVNSYFDPQTLEQHECDLCGEMEASVKYTISQQNSICNNCLPNYGLDWIIVGGETGKKARKCEISWIESLVRQCSELGLPIFVKQLGSHHKNHSDFDSFPDSIKRRFWPV